MSDVIVNGIPQVMRKLQAKSAQINRNSDRATNAAARSLVPYVKAALPRDPKASRPGYLRSHVKVYQVLGAGLFESTYKVKLTGTLAHLVYGDVRAHDIRPRRDQSLATAGRMRRITKAGRIATFTEGTAGEGARALVINGNARAAAHVKGHRAARSPLPTVLAEHRSEALAVAREVLKHG